jgi:putative ABC transport system ATP-binding protein
MQSTSKPAIIQLENITKTYGTGNTLVSALANVNLTVKQGEYCAIMGASGSGKSTMMNIIGCLDSPTSGAYYLDGINVAGLADKELAQIRNLKLGFVFQQFYLLPQLTALENVMLPMAYAGLAKPDRIKRSTEALIRVGLAQRLHNKPNQLSGGQQQRVAIARSIANNPVVLLADEPTGALDSKTTEEILEIFAELNHNGITVIVITHEREVGNCAERIIWFQDGKILHPELSKS